MRQKFEEATVFLKNELVEVEKWEATGVDVDRKTLEGRRDTRGFTVSMGKKAATDPEERREKRAFTLTEGDHRRGDSLYISVAELKGMQDKLTQRMRRGSVSVVFDTLTEATMENVRKDRVASFYVGVMTKNQSFGDERERISLQGAFRPDVPQPVISCIKGSKGPGDTTPNQDNFSVVQLHDGHTIACCFDGHGLDGHRVSTRTVTTLPHYLMQSSFYPHDMNSALMEAFDFTQRDLVVNAVEEGFDVQGSGTTAVCTVWKGDTVWSANIGDSKLIIGSEVNKKTLI